MPVVELGLPIDATPRRPDSNYHADRDRQLSECLQHLAQAERALGALRGGLQKLCLVDGLDRHPKESNHGADERAYSLRVASMTPSARSAPSCGPTKSGAEHSHGADHSQGVYDAELIGLCKDKLLEEYLEHHMEPRRRVRQRGVRSSAVKKFLRTKRDQAEACIQLMFALTLVVVFSSSVFFHCGLEQLHAVDTAITFDILENANFAFSGVVPFENGRMGHKTFYDVNRIADFWSWFDLGLVPIFWPDAWEWSETRANTYAKCLSPSQALEAHGWNTSLLGGVRRMEAEFPNPPCPAQLAMPEDQQKFYGTPATPMYLFYNSILGGVRLSQWRTPDVPCPGGDEELTRAAYTGACVPDVGNWLMPELHTALARDASMEDRPGGETQFLLSGASSTAIRRQLRELEDQAWFDPHTAKVQVLFTTFNPHLDLLTATFIILLVNRGGHFHKLIEPVSLWLHPYNYYWAYVFDGSFALLILKLIYDEGSQIIRHVRQLGFFRGIRVYSSVVNAVDWLNVIYSVLLMGFWYRYLLKLEELRGCVRTARVDVPGSWVDESDRSSFFQITEDAVSQMRALILMLGFYPFVVVLRFFEAASMQPRLAIVTQTLLVASTDIIHFGMVFACVFLIYAVAGMIFFGQETPEFANFGRTTTSLFRILLGDFEWDHMMQIGRQPAAAWFWTFSVFVNLIMLNMLLAIIMDVHTQVKGKIGFNAPTLLSQIVDIGTRFKEVRAGRAIPFSRVLKKLDPTDLDETDDADVDDLRYTPESLAREVPNLTEAQAEAILIESSEQALAERRGTMSFTDMTLAVKVIDVRVKELYHMMVIGQRRDVAL